jgi:hypothetical protein
LDGDVKPDVSVLDTFNVFDEDEAKNLLFPFVSAGAVSSTEQAPLDITSNIFAHMGDYQNSDDSFGAGKSSNYYLNVGTALETLRRELPMVFAASDLDFSIFADSITVTNGNQNKLVMSKALYVGAVKSVRMASALSSIYPSMNVKKIEYIEDCRTIQCLVDVVLPDTVRVDGMAVWEGMFYFGLDTQGLIETHIFDRKISNHKSSPRLSAQSMPWLRAAPSWSSDLLGGAARPRAGRVGAFGGQTVSTATQLTSTEDLSV